MTRSLGDWFMHRLDIPWHALFHLGWLAKTKSTDSSLSSLTVLLRFNCFLLFNCASTPVFLMDDDFDLAPSSQDLSPSVFELIAEQKLDSLLTPALRYAATQVAIHYPRLLLRPMRYFDEIALLAMLLIQSHYLKRYQCTFTERFYGLQRYPMGGKEPSMKLTSRNMLMSLFFVVVAPYLKSKVELLYQQIKEDWGDEQDDLFEENVPSSTMGSGPRDASSKFNFAQTLRKWFLRCYPFAHLVYAGNQFLYIVLYAIKRTKYFNFGLHLSKLQVKWATESNPILPTPTSSSSAAVASSSLWSSLLSFPLDFLQTALPLSIFCYKFWVWLVQTHSPHPLSTSSASFSQVLSVFFQEKVQNIPPPPPLHSPHPQGKKRLAKGTCSLCQKTISNPTCLTTGYVFCYPCIHNWIQQYQACPITLKPMAIEDLRQVYTNDQ